MDKLEYVLMLAEERNLTRAAGRLYISQPTLSNYITRLEEDLGVKLFDRSVQPVAITEAGTIYIDEMKKIQIREHAMRARLQQMDGSSRTFSVGIPGVRGEYILPGIVSRFTKEYPGVSVKIDNQVEEYLEKNLENGFLDLGIGVLTTAFSRLHYECLREESIYLLVPRTFDCVANLPQDEGTPDHPHVLNGSELDGECLIVARTGGGQYRSTMRLMNNHGIHPGSAIQGGSLNTVYKLTGYGAGFCFLPPQRFMETYPGLTDKIACCTLQDAPVYQKIYAAYQEDSPNIAMIQEFLRLYRQQENRT